MNSKKKKEKKRAYLDQIKALLSWLLQKLTYKLKISFYNNY